MISVLGLAVHSVSSFAQAPSSVARCPASREQSVVRSPKNLHSKTTPGSAPSFWSERHARQSCHATALRSEPCEQHTMRRKERHSIQQEGATRLVHMCLQCKHGSGDVSPAHETSLSVAPVDQDARLRPRVPSPSADQTDRTDARAASGKPTCSKGRDWSEDLCCGGKNLNPDGHIEIGLVQTARVSEVNGLIRMARPASVRQGSTLRPAFVT